MPVWLALAAWQKAAGLVHQCNSEKLVSITSRTVHFVSWYMYYCLTAVRILREDGSEASRGELGRIVCKLPMAPGTMSTLFGADERFKKTYFEAFKVLTVCESIGK